MTAQKHPSATRSGLASPLDPASLLNGEVERITMSPLYVAGLMVVAVAMLLLPLAYLALVAAVAYGVYYHAVHNTEMIYSPSGRVRRGSMAMYLLLLVGGAIALLFMLKPLFARKAVTIRPLALDPQHEKLLFSYVERLCGIIGAPPPRRISVTCDVNAAASFHRGLLSLFTRDMELTIGMPLVAGMSLRQFSGVLAHEFGHFSQGMAMRLSYVIERVNHWFARVVYERDQMDAHLEAAAESYGGFHVVRVFVWLSRRVLWVLMIIGRAISCFLSRQMEHDADLHESQIAGSDTFAATSRQLLLLNVAAGGTFSSLRRSWTERKLADDLPQLIASEVSRIPANIVAAAEESEARERTRLFSTHPATPSRVSYVQQWPTRGIVRSDLPASCLFKDFEATSKAVTFVFYQDTVGPEVTRANLIASSSLVAESQGQISEHEAGERYFRPRLTLMRPILLARDDIAAPADPKAAVRELRESHARLLETLAEADTAFNAFDEADTRIIRCRSAKSLLQARLPVNAKEYGLTHANLEGVRAALTDALRTQQSARRSLDAFDATMHKRFCTALSLLRVPAVAARLPDAAELRDDVDRLVSTLSSLRGAMPWVEELRVGYPSLEVFTQVDLSTGKPDAVESAVSAIARHVHEQMAEIRSTLRDVNYPFTHVDGQVSVAAFLIPVLPPVTSPDGVLEAANAIGSKFTLLYFRLMGRLAVIAEKVEALAGLKPLPASTAMPSEQPA